MHGELTKLHRRLKENDELLWPFSNPPIIKDEDDIEIARYSGEKQSSYDYRVYLAEKYGRYKMTYSGIHYNYSFSDDILKRGAELDGAVCKARSAYSCQRAVLPCKAQTARGIYC